MGGAPALVLAFLIGVAVGAVVVWRLGARGQAPAPAEASTEPPAAPSPSPVGEQLTLQADEGGLKPVIESSRSLVEDLERRYGQGTAEPGKPPPAGGTRRPRRGGRSST